MQIAPLGLYLHTIQDSASHSTYCGDEAPAPPDGGDPGTKMFLNGNDVNLLFGNSCGASPHLASHLQETGSGERTSPAAGLYGSHFIIGDRFIEFSRGKLMRAYRGHRLGRAWSLPNTSSAVNA